MDITITDAKRCLRWETLQTLLCDVTNDSSVRLTSVARTAGSGIDYSAPGSYCASFRGERCGRVVVNLRVQEECDVRGPEREEGDAR